jgi:hypothetical protein
MMMKKNSIIAGIVAASVLAGVLPSAWAAEQAPRPGAEKSPPAGSKGNKGILGLPGAEALPKNIPDFLLALVDQFLDELLGDPSLQEMFTELLKEIFKAELVRVEAIPKDPAKAEYVGKFMDEFVEELLHDRKVRQLYMQQLRELLRVQILLELAKDPEMKKLFKPEPR